MFGGRYNPFYIKFKIEIGTLAEKLSTKRVKNCIMVVMILYIYGAICLKYVSGAESLIGAVSFAIWKNPEGLKIWLGYDPYYWSLFIFGFFCCYFSFGNIEN